MRYKITLSYDGSAFCGWQTQPNAATVQDSLESAFSRLLGERIPVTGAGRTDTGVNAIGYVAHFDAAADIDAAHLPYKLNAILPRAISVSDIVPVADDFHARFDARRREYVYFMHRGKDPFVERWSWRQTRQLDIEAMTRAAQSLLGTHDFHCFEKFGGDNKTSVCTVYEAGWHSYVPTPHALCGDVFPAPGREAASARQGAHTRGGADGGYWYFRISADRFLRNMVRAIVGTLVEVGAGRRSAADFAALPDSGADRRAAGESVPGHALFLSKIAY